jgi:hypothetical protein
MGLVSPPSMVIKRGQKCNRNKLKKHRISHPQEHNFKMQICFITFSQSIAGVRGWVGLELMGLKVEES